MRAFFRDTVADITNRITASRIVSKATATDKTELDEEEAAEVSAFANDVSPALVVSNVKSRLESRTPAVQYLAMRLLSWLIDNCSSATHDEIARDSALHDRLLVLAGSLQEVDQGAARSAVRVRAEARRLLLDASRTFLGATGTHEALATLANKFTTATGKRLERAVLMDGRRVRFRTDEDVRLISPRGGRRGTTPFDAAPPGAAAAAATATGAVSSPGAVPAAPAMTFVVGTLVENVVPEATVVRADPSTVTARLATTATTAAAAGDGDDEEAAFDLDVDDSDSDSDGSCDNCVKDAFERQHRRHPHPAKGAGDVTPPQSALHHHSPAHPGAQQPPLPPLHLGEPRQAPPHPSPAPSSTAVVDSQSEPGALAPSPACNDEPPRRQDTEEPIVDDDTPDGLRRATGTRAIIAVGAKP
jgi:hypothetical protein